MTAVLCLLLGLAAAQAPVDLEPIGRLKDKELREVSGVVRSRRHPGIFWLHNDSGNPPALFAVRGDGTVVRRYDVGVPNLDWEDIALDDRGFLYLGDIGNNGGALPVRAVHRFVEPDPAVEPAGPLRPDRTVFYRFPGGKRFDAEGLFVDGDQVTLVSKRFDLQPAELYRVPFEKPASLLGPAVLERVGALPGFTESATGADLSPDGRRLAVVSPGRTRLYRRDPGGPWQPAGALRYKTGGFEAIAWDGEALRLIDEPGRMYRLRPPAPPRRRSAASDAAPSPAPDAAAPPPERPEPRN